LANNKPVTPPNKNITQNKKKNSNFYTQHITKNKTKQPIKQLNGRGQTYQQCQTPKKCTGIQIHTRQKHMVRPNKKTNQTNQQQTIYHGNTTKHKTHRTTINNRRQKTKNGDNNNINLGVAKKPKQMLKQQKVTPTNKIIKTCIKITVKQQHSNTTSQYGQT